jgi:hypothetical protein
MREILVWDLLGGIVKLKTYDRPEDGFQEYINECWVRLQDGAKEYANHSFNLDPKLLIGEIEEELMDVCNWSFILFMRLQAMKDAMLVANPEDDDLVEWDGEQEI